MKSEKQAAHLARLAEARRGKPLSDETKKKIAASRKGDGIGPANAHWKGGSYVCKGYRYKYAPGHPHATHLGYVLEHRLVAEAMLRRLLLPSEAVHHVNGVRLDNRPENLEVCTSNGKHSAAHHIHRDIVGRFACA